MRHWLALPPPHNQQTISPFAQGGEKPDADRPGSTQDDTIGRGQWQSGHARPILSNDDGAAVQVQIGFFQIDVNGRHVQTQPI